MIAVVVKHNVLHTDAVLRSLASAYLQHRAVCGGQVQCHFSGCRRLSQIAGAG